MRILIIDMPLQSNEHQERSVLLEDFVFINDDILFVLSFVRNLSSDVVEEERLSNLISEFSMDGHCFELS